MFGCNFTCRTGSRWAIFVNVTRFKYLRRSGAARAGQLRSFCISIKKAARKNCSDMIIIVVVTVLVMSRTPCHHVVQNCSNAEKLVYLFTNAQCNHSGLAHSMYRHRAVVIIVVVDVVVNHTSK